MPNSESQLETWSKQGPTSQFTSTYDTLKSVLNDSQSPYYLKDFTIFLQGSYKNDTNVYGDSDVDVVIRLDSIFYTDLYFLSEEERARYDAQRSPGTYTLDEFKTAVVGWLTKKYGSEVQPGKKAIVIKGNGTRRDADVLACAKLRRDYSFHTVGNPSFVGRHLLLSARRDADRKLSRKAQRKLHDKAPRNATVVQAHGPNLQESAKYDDWKRHHQGRAGAVVFHRGTIVQRPDCEFRRDRAIKLL